MSTKISATTLSALLALMPQLEVAAADSHKPEANSHGVDTHTAHDSYGEDYAVGNGQLAGATTRVPLLRATMYSIIPYPCARSFQCHPCGNNSEGCALAGLTLTDTDWTSATTSLIHPYAPRLFVLMLLP
ncbi:hypothetical protein C8Q72DRAFT_888612 [Fomitopsis betulina]|nr:hypothetical protein C8Q72DRAFT_888612 [Fomitopsis betulina]